AIAMLDHAQADAALRTLADGFLRDLRPVNGSGEQGWGQFVGQPDGRQVGLYGSSAGLIKVSTAYTHVRVPQAVVNYLARLWGERNTPGTSGARYFSLTARRAFFLMALR